MQPGVCSVGRGVCGHVACGRGPRGCVCGPQGVTYGHGRTLQALLLAFRTAVSGRQVPTCTDVLGLETGMHVHLLT